MVQRGVISLGLNLKNMTEAQVQKVIKKQKSGDPRMFGEIAISLGFIDDQAIRKYLNL